MTSIKKRLARKTAKKTAWHSVRGTASKLWRNPRRSGTLLAVGGIAGFLAGRLMGHTPRHAN